MYRVLRPGSVCFIAGGRSHFWTAIPLRAHWPLARLARLTRCSRASYCKPTRATILSAATFAALLNTQPRVEVRRLRGSKYHYAICRKAERPIEILAAD